MATDKVVSVELTTLERLYVQRSLDLLQASIRRSISKEMPGSEVTRIREGEIRTLIAIGSKLGG